MAELYKRKTHLKQHRNSFCPLSTTKEEAIFQNKGFETIAEKQGDTDYLFNVSLKLTLKYNWWEYAATLGGQFAGRKQRVLCLDK
ncbi:MAG: hypothetical protein U5L09_15605 [Bacteroidales bacterium]|nr:hypothetical protein [Bacteroidales bacterium]